MRLKTKKLNEARRMIAANFFEQGLGPAEVARRLDVTHGAASHWKKALEESGRDGLASKPNVGGKPRLSEQDRARLAEMMAQGPRAHGFRSELWTLPRITVLIKKEFGIEYHFAHVSKILKRMKMSPQKPVLRARERNEEKIEQWRTERWPAIKKGRQNQENPS